MSAFNNSKTVKGLSLMPSGYVSELHILASWDRNILSSSYLLADENGADL